MLTTKEGAQSLAFGVCREALGSESQLARRKAARAEGCAGVRKIAVLPPGLGRTTIPAHIYV